MKKGTTYHQLSYEERVSIATLHEHGESIRSIARVLKRSPNTIAHELQEKQVGGVYTPKQAQRKTYWRRYNSKWACLKVSRDDRLHHFVLATLPLGWSPERIAGYARRHGIMVSTKAVYKFAHTRGLERYLFWSRVKKRSGSKRKRQGFKDPAKQGCSARPPLEGSGHMELDFIVSRHSTAVLMVLVDRSTRVTMVRRLAHKTHRAVLGALRVIHARYPLKTITTDNDIVFRKWQELEHVLSVPFFFTTPYHSWEKGLVENTNRWIRVFVPKRSDIAMVTDAECRRIEQYLNHTPRQCLGYRTAVEVLSAVS